MRGRAAATLRRMLSRDPCKAPARTHGVREAQPAIVVHSGDFLSPSLLGKRFRGAQMIDAMNHIGVDYVVLGNHEFDFESRDPGTLAARLAEA